MPSDARLALHKAHIEKVEKYTYFLLTASGAAIAFAITQAQTATLSWSKLPLAVAILCWGFSFYFGCRQLGSSMNILQQNYQFLRIQDGLHPDFPKTPEVIATIGQHIEKESNKSGRAGLWQFKFLILGAVFYIAWHITEMCLRTPIKVA